MANCFFLTSTDGYATYIFVEGGFDILRFEKFSSTNRFYENILCDIYDPICKHADLFFGKKILDLTTVKLFLF